MSVPTEEVPSPQSDEDWLKSSEAEQDTLMLPTISLKRKKSMRFKFLALAQIGLQRKTDGKIWIHQNDVLRGILQEGKLPIMGLPKRKGTRKKMTLDITDSPDQVNETGSQRLTRILLEKALQKNQQERKIINIEEMDEFRWSKEMYNHLMEREKTLMEETDCEVLTHELHGHRKKEILHRRWTKDVYDPLKKNLGVAIDELPWTAVEATRHNMHKLYLQYVNTKGHAFLDTLNPKEYPKYVFQYGVPSKIKAKVGPDPLMYQEKQRFEEDRVILNCETGVKYNDFDLEQIKQNSLPQMPLGRHSTDCKKWLQVPLINIESTPREASRRRMCAGRHNMSSMSDILQDPQPKTENLPNRRSISQPTYISVHVQTAGESFPDPQSCFPKTAPEQIVQKMSF